MITLKSVMAFTYVVLMVATAILQQEAHRVLLPFISRSNGLVFATATITLSPPENRDPYTSTPITFTPTITLTPTITATPPRVGPTRTPGPSLTPAPTKTRFFSTTTYTPTPSDGTQPTWTPDVYPPPTNAIP